MNRRSILIDVPIVAYQTWCISYFDPEDDELNNVDAALDSVKRMYPYDRDHKHVL